MAGEGGHRVEVCPQQAVDLLLRGGGHRPAPLQHHPHTEKLLLHPAVGLHPAVRAEHQDEEGTPQDGEGEHAYLYRPVRPVTNHCS